MIATLSYSEVKQQFDHILAQIVSTTMPVRFEFEGKTLTISVSESADKFACLEPHPNCLVGSLEEIVHLGWSGEVHHDLP